MLVHTCVHLKYIWYHTYIQHKYLLYIGITTKQSCQLLKCSDGPSLSCRLNHKVKGFLGLSHLLLTLLRVLPLAKSMTPTSCISSDHRLDPLFIFQSAELFQILPPSFTHQQIGSPLAEAMGELSPIPYDVMFCDCMTS